MARAMICVGGDTTTHGGRVLEGSATATIDGKTIAGVGHKVLCPQCKRIFPILPGLSEISAQRCRARVRAGIVG